MKECGSISSLELKTKKIFGFILSFVFEEIAFLFWFDAETSNVSPFKTIL